MLCHDDAFSASYYNNSDCSGEPYVIAPFPCRGHDYMGCVCNNDRICDYAKFRQYHDPSGCGNHWDIDGDEYNESAIVRDTCVDIAAGNDDVYMGMAFKCDHEASELVPYQCGKWTEPNINFTNLIANISVIAKPLNESGRGRVKVCDLECYEGGELNEGLSDGEIVGIVIGCLAGLVIIGAVVFVVKLRRKDERVAVNGISSDDYDGVDQTDEE